MTAYADDLVGYLNYKLSIELFFQKFDEWGKYQEQELIEKKRK